MSESISHGEAGREGEVQKKPEMNLLTNYEETVLAIAMIEFYGNEKAAKMWVDRQLKKDEEGRYQTNTAGEALSQLEKLSPEQIEETRAKRDQGERMHAMGSIYGADGYNRYMVLPNGEVMFSEFHAIYPKEETLERAKDAGFDIF